MGRIGRSVFVCVFFAVSSLAPSTNSVELPVLSANVELVTNVPDILGISAAFDPARPYMYLSTLHGLDVYDISSPEFPVLVGALPIVMYQNENVNIGTARRDGKTFVLIGTDLVGAVTPTDPTRTAVIPDEDDIFVQHLYVIDVTDPTSPFIRSDLGTKTYTHTVSCLSETCRYAYTAGTMKAFSIIDLSKLDRPREVKVVKDPWGWHDWQVDASGVVWQAGDHGSVAFDVSDPLKPRVLNSTNRLALSGAEWNQFIHHNTARPYAKRMPIGSVKKQGAASVFRGDVLLVTEENLRTGSCEDEATFQTWEIPSLRHGDNPQNRPGMGTIRPLDRWRSTFLDTDQPNPVGVECSAHYFDFHQSGFVAQAWYTHGVRILDVRDARKIKQVGYFVTRTQNTWSTYWVPKRDKSGRVAMGADGTPQRSSLVYSVDLARGLDVLRVSLPKTKAGSTKAVASPERPDWLHSPVPDTEESSLAFSCRVR